MNGNQYKTAVDCVKGVNGGYIKGSKPKTLRDTHLMSNQKSCKILIYRLNQVIYSLITIQCFGTRRQSPRWSHLSLSPTLSPTTPSVCQICSRLAIHVNATFDCRITVHVFHRSTSTLTLEPVSRLLPTLSGAHMWRTTLNLVQARCQRYATTAKQASASPHWPPRSVSKRPRRRTTGQ
jgi:hypothetical protein